MLQFCMKKGHISMITPVTEAPQKIVKKLGTVDVMFIYWTLNFVVTLSQDSSKKHCKHGGECNCIPKESS